MIALLIRLIPLAVLSAVAGSPLMADSNMDFIYEIPDLTQTQIRGRQHNHGSEYCGPVAVANSLSWLADEPQAQARLAERLASRAYMNTDIWKGTTTPNLLKGVHAIALDLFGGYSSLEYQGWKRHPDVFDTGVATPDLNWIKAGVANDAAVWLNVGWYRYERGRNTYHRVGGHWVTLAGYDGNVLIIHDPAPRAGQAFANEFVHTSVIGSGMLADRLSGMFRPARGYLLLGKGMHIKSIADVAIVDGAVRFKL